MYTIPAEQIKDVPGTYREFFTDESGLHWAMTLWYDLGGYSYATSTTTQRGYVLSLIPCRKNDMGHYLTQAWAGTKMTVQTCKRYSAKQFAMLRDLYFFTPTEQADETVTSLFEHVRSKL